MKHELTRKGRGSWQVSTVTAVTGTLHRQALVPASFLQSCVFREMQFMSQGVNIATHREWTLYARLFWETFLNRKLQSGAAQGRVGQWWGRQWDTALWELCCAVRFGKPHPPSSHTGWCCFLCTLPLEDLGKVLNRIAAQCPRCQSHDHGLVGMHSIAEL